MTEKKLITRSPIKKISDKQAKRNRELAKIPRPADGKCEICHEFPDWRGLQKHHKKFRSGGGDDKRSNLVWCCYPCANGPLGHKTEVKSKPSVPVPKVGLSGWNPKPRLNFTREMQTGRKERKDADRTETD